MKAQVSETHYYIYLDYNSVERVKLMKETLEASLQDGNNGNDLGKKLVLALNKEIKDTKVEYNPKESTWDKLKSIHITLSFDDYNRLAMNLFTIIRDGINSYQIEETDTNSLI